MLNYTQIYVYQVELTDREPEISHITLV